jgi:hypothetical protein
MKAKWINLIWGIILIAAGALFLAQNLGYLDQLELPVLMVVFAVVSLLFFVTYFINGIGNWGWLFPAFIFAALALVLWMQTQSIEGPWMGVPVLVAVALPFLVAFAQSPRQNWWALIPAWVMVVISAIVIFAEQAQGEWIGALVLFSIGFPFLVVYLADRKNWWALIPAWTLLVIGLIVLLSTQVQGEWIAVLVLMGIALPFFVVYFRNRDNWWALIPAGVLASSAVSVFLAGLFGEEGSLLAKPGVLTGVTFLGIAATFLALWLQRSSQPTDWAIYAAGVSAVVALVSLLFGASQVVFPITIIAVGILILYLALRSRKTT